MQSAVAFAKLSFYGRCQKCGFDLGGMYVFYLKRQLSLARLIYRWRRAILKGPVLKNFQEWAVYPG